MSKKTKSQDEGVGRLAVLQALAKLKTPSMQDLISTTGFSRSTVQRQLKELREIFSMEIEYRRSGKQRGAVGYYVVVSWGLFNPKMFSTK